MKDRKYDVTIICLLLIFLLFITCIRIITKEVLYDQFGKAGRICGKIMFDLNSTVDVKINDDDTGDPWLINRIEEQKAKLTAYTSSAMPFNKIINQIVTSMDKVLVEAPHTYQNMKHASDISDSLVAFSNECNDIGADFIFVGTPTLGSAESYKNGEIWDNSDYESIYYIVKYLKSKGVDAIDLALFFAENDGCIYDESLHWGLISAFQSMQVLCEELNNKGFDYGKELYDIKGAIDLTSSKAISDTEISSHSLPVPAIAMDNEVELDYNGEKQSGKYQNILFSTEESNGAYYCRLALNNQSTYSIHNPDSKYNIGKKILVLGDSFSWPQSEYLAAFTEYVYYIHLWDLSTEEMLNFIRENHIDVVVYSKARL